MSIAKVLADSVSASGYRLTTLEVTFPRFILAEFNTHRVFSRNSASSRAIPVVKQLSRVIEDPFIPNSFPINQAGMSASEYCYPGDDEYKRARDTWLCARDAAVLAAEDLLDLGIHKQISNRLLEPFMWHTVIVSSTEWENFFKLRCNEQAQPEMRETAEVMRDALNASTPEDYSGGGWHLPLMWFNGDELLGVNQRIQVSVARCARVSYLTHDGVRDIVADLGLFDRLRESGHLSPFEHVATPDDDQDMWANFKGWRQLRRTFEPTP